MAVLTYLRRILESLDHPDMINLILHYLLALPDHIPKRNQAPRTSISDARKRKSMDLATMVAETTDTSVTPLLFNLVDLILACLRSKNQQTIHVTLQLVSAILKRHHRYAVMTLLRTDILPSRTYHRTIGAHEQEIEYLISLASSIGGHDNFDEVYESAIKDNMARLESHPCSLKLVAPKVSVNNHKLPEIPDSLPGAPRDVKEHTLRPDDPLLNKVLDLLETFFLNAVETNLSVTETIVDLAICGYMSIDGWLARSPKSYTYNEEDMPTPENAGDAEQEDDSAAAEEAERVKAMEKCRARPRWVQSSVPRILDILKRLEDQVNKYKDIIPRFDELVQQRREAFQTADLVLNNHNNPPTSTRAQDTPDHPSMDELSRSGSPSRPSALEGFAQRLLSELGTPSRSSSPRGRKEVNRSSGSGMNSPAPGSAAVSSPRPVPIPQPVMPREAIGSFPRSLSPSSNRDESADGREGVEVPSAAVREATAFAAVDQSILSRKVGLPGEKVEPIPLKFDKTPMPEPVKEDVEDDDNEAQEQADDDGEEVSKDDDDKDEGEEEKTKADKGEEEDLVSVSHIITNVIILQSFLFELASLLQVRAGLFDEVRFV